MISGSGVSDTLKKLKGELVGLISFFIFEILILNWVELIRFYLYLSPRNICNFFIIIERRGVQYKYEFFFARVKISKE